MRPSVRAPNLQAVGGVLVNSNLQRIVVRPPTVGLLAAIAPDISWKLEVAREIDGLTVRTAVTGWVRQACLYSCGSGWIKCVGSDEVAAVGTHVTYAQNDSRRQFALQRNVPVHGIGCRQIAASHVDIERQGKTG